MSDGLSAALRVLVSWLEAPVILLLFGFGVLALFELGLTAGERLQGMRLLRRSRDAGRIEQVGRVRVGRADILARVGPMLGLMGTLIPLGPGLAGLGQGDVRALAESVTLAFDTTVLGLLIGAIGYVVGQIRRRSYSNLLEGLEAGDGR